MKIYLDTCCYCRFFDDLAQEKTRKECDIIMNIFEYSSVLGNTIIGSPVLYFELNRIEDNEKRQKVIDLYNENAIIYTDFSPEIEKRAQMLMQSGLKLFDSYHLSFAEAAGVNVLLTTDNNFEKVCSKINLKIRVTNPLKLWEV